jgi:hypothetical protein
MTHRQRKRLLWTLVAALGAGTAAAAVLPLALPLAVSDSAATPADDSGRGATAEGTGSGKAGLTSAELAVIHERPLRRPLYDPSPQPEPEPEQPKLEIELIGTAIEPGFTYAMFRTSGGEQKLVRIGDRIEGAELLSVRSGEADLSFHQETVTLRLEKEEQ